MDNVKPVRACTVFYLLRRLKAMLRVVQMRLEKTFKVFFYLLCIMNKDDYVTMFETAILTLDNIRIAVHNETYDTSTQKPLLHLLAHLQALCNHVDYSDTPFFE